MIQRKQSVYLLLGALAVAAVFLFDGVFETEAAQTLGWYAPALLVIGIVTALAAIVAIFLYGDRNRQKRVVVGIQYCTLLFMLVLYGGLVLAGAAQSLNQGALDTVTIIGLALPILAYVLFYLARRGIQADIELVRSMDRLR